MRMKWLGIAMAFFLWLIPLRGFAQQPPQRPGQQSAQLPGDSPLNPSSTPDTSVPPREATVPNSTAPLLSPSEILGPESGTNVSEADARRVRAAAGISDGDASKHVVLIDGKTLHDHQILLVVSLQEPPCVTAEVFAHHGNDIQRVWSVSATPEGDAFCRLPGCSVPQVAATKGGEVQISVPFRRYGERHEVCDDNFVLTYHPVGASFELEKDEMRGAWQLCNLSQEVLDAATYETKEADRLALIWVFRLPGGASSALVFAKTPDGPVVTAYDAPLQRAIQDKHAPTLVPPSECIDAAKTAPMVRAQLPLAGDEAQAILDKLPNLGRNAAPDNCAASFHPGCSYTLDGPMFVVIFPDGSNRTVHNPPMVAGVRGPGGSASDWAEELHVLVGDQPFQ